MATFALLLLILRNPHNYKKLELKFDDFSYSELCGDSTIEMGIISYGQNQKPEDKVQLKFINISINGSSNIRNQEKLEQVKLSYSHLLKDDNLAVCNDGTPASYYSNFELNGKSPKKIIID